MRTYVFSVLRHYRVDAAKLPDHEFSQTSPYLQRRALRLASSPTQKLNLLSVEEPNFDLICQNSPKKTKKHHKRSKCGRSHSITPHSSHAIPDVEKLKEKIHKRDFTLEGLDPNQNQKLEVAHAGLAGVKPSKSGLPRTLSTSVLRIKHRRTFWERVTR